MSRPQLKDTPELVRGCGQRGCVCGAEADDQARLGGFRAVVGAQAGGGDAELGRWPENWPAIPCHDLSGVVAALGDGVTSW